VVEQVMGWEDWKVVHNSTARSQVLQPHLTEKCGRIEMIWCLMFAHGMIHRIMWIHSILANRSALYFWTCTVNVCFILLDKFTHGYF